MNSTEEKELFESHGWVYDYIKRQWTSPKGTLVITTDELMYYTSSPDGEELLRLIVAQPD